MKIKILIFLLFFLIIVFPLISTEFSENFININKQIHFIQPPNIANDLVINLFFNDFYYKVNEAKYQTKNLMYYKQRDLNYHTQFELILAGINLNKIVYYDYDYENNENPIRRAEILFFGSLTFATFGGWLFLSIFNSLIYNQSFGTLRREQFLLLYLGSSIISISVVLSDLFITLKPKVKKIEFY